MGTKSCSITWRHCLINDDETKEESGSSINEVDGDDAEEDEVDDDVEVDAEEDEADTEDGPGNLFAYDASVPPFMDEPVRKR